MDNRDIHGCPAPSPVTLYDRLIPCIGKNVTVYTPGFPDLTQTTGRLTQVTPACFVVGSTRVFWNTSFYLDLRAKAKTMLDYRVSATAEELGGISGRLVCVGRDFVELRQKGHAGVTLFPLNLFTEVQCEPDEEE